MVSVQNDADDDGGEPTTATPSSHQQAPRTRIKYPVQGIPLTLMIPEIRQDIRSRKKVPEHSDRVLAQNSDAVLAGVVGWAGDIIFAKNYQEV